LSNIHVSSYYRAYLLKKGRASTCFPERESEVDILAVLAYEGRAEPISRTAKSDIFYIYSFVTPVNTDSTALAYTFKLLY
jgi:hypothetical protein